MDAYAYIRVSGKGQEDGHGFDRQAETVESFSKRARYRVVRTYRDTHTGTVDAVERPGFARMIAELNNGVHTIIVERLDRLARAVVAQEHTILWLAAHNIDLIVADSGENITEAYRSDPMKKALVQMQAVFAELEKSMIVKKLRSARQKVRERVGKCEGRKAYGEVHPQERAAVQRIRELRRKRPGRPRTGYCKIAQILQAEGYPTRQGRPWQPSTIQSIVNGPVYPVLATRKQR